MPNNIEEILKKALSSERFAYDYTGVWRFLSLTRDEHKALLDHFGLPMPQPKLKTRVKKSVRPQSESGTDVAPFAITTPLTAKELEDEVKDVLDPQWELKTVIIDDLPPSREHRVRDVSDYRVDPRLVDPFSLPSKDD